MTELRVVEDHLNLPDERWSVTQNKYIYYLLSPQTKRYCHVACQMKLFFISYILLEISRTSFWLTIYKCCCKKCNSDICMICCRRIQKDTLELVEDSLDFNLTSNCVRFRFQDTPILQGLSVHEAHGHVIILVATVTSVHRLVFPHPNKLHKYVSIQTQVHAHTHHTHTHTHIYTHTHTYTKLYG